MRLFTIIFLLSVSAPLHAVIETYEFSEDQQRERYNQFIEELRCPKCQNQNLSGSNSPIAADLRRELYRLLSEGKNDDQIVEFMVDRYGDFILYRPQFKPETAILWLSPVIFLLIGAIVFMFIMKKQSKLLETGSSLDEDERQKLSALLAEKPSERGDQ